MRLYREFSTWDKAGGRTAVDPTALTAVTKTLAGVTVESLTPAKEATGRWYVDTANAKYTSGAVYQIAWTATIAGDSFTRTVRYVQYSSTADTTPPGAPSIGSPTVTEDTATFPHVAPSDSDYSQTIIFCVPVLAGDVVQGTGAGTSIAVVGLAPATSYIAVAIAYDASGNASPPDAVGVTVPFTTSTATAPTYPAYVKWWPDGRTTMHSFAPAAVDPSKKQSRRVHRLGNCRILTFQVECGAPVENLEITGFGFRVHVKGDGRMPGGIASRTVS